MVKQFASAMEQPLYQKWELYTELENMRSNLITEEVYEFEEETTLPAPDPQKVLKELADIVYVTYGYAATFGWDLDEAVRRVHESNMSKLGDDGKPVYREDGKVMKGSNYKPPYLGDLV